MYDGPRTDLRVGTDTDAADEHRARADEAAVTDLRRFSGNLADGHVLVNAAVRPDNGIARDENAVQPVRERRHAPDHRIRANVPAVPRGAAAHKKCQHVPAKAGLCALLPPVEPPEARKIVPARIVDDLLPDAHTYNPSSRSIICGNDRPIPFIMLGKRLCAVRPGIVFTSLNTNSPEGVRKRSTRAKPEQPSAR